MELSNFHFLRPSWFLLLPPCLVLIFHFYRIWWKEADWSGVVDPHLLRIFLTRDRVLRRSLFPWFFSLVTILMLTSLAGPVWVKKERPLFKKKTARILILDVSSSMLAEDVYPNRIERAKYKIQDLLKLTKEVETGLVVYAGDAYVISPITRDLETIAALLPGIDPTIMPYEGSRPDRAIVLATKLLDRNLSRKGEIILITDGIQRELEGNILENLKGNRLSVLSIGTENGAPIPDNNAGFIKNSNGGIVFSKIEVDLLDYLSMKGGGIHIKMQSNDNDIVMLLNQSDFKENYESEDLKKLGDQWKEEGPWLLLIVLPLFALGFRKGAIFMILMSTSLLYFLFSPIYLYAFDWEFLWKNSNQRGKEMFEEKKHEEAAKKFINPQWKGLSYYRAGQYEQAVQEWNELSDPRSIYNLGNALAYMKNYEKAIDAYDRVLESNPDHKDAKFNKNILQKMLNEQKKINDKSQFKRKQDEKEGEKKKKSQTNISDIQQKNSFEQNDMLNEQSKNKVDQRAEKKSSLEEIGNENRGQNELKLQHNEKEFNGSDEKANENEKNQGDYADPKDNSYIIAETTKIDEKNKYSQKFKQWLQKIPDDPSRLLRNKLISAHKKKNMKFEKELETW